VSSRGRKYVMILYDYDSNAILTEAIKSRSAKDMIKANKTIRTYPITHGLKPELQHLDNEASQKLKDFVHTKQIDYQLVHLGATKGG
jgi:hypothetical protein